jgi:Zn-dependent protease with chaperone function
MLLVALTTLLMPLLYLGVIFAVGYGMALYGRHFLFRSATWSGVGGIHLIFLKVIVYGVPMFAGAVILVFLLKPLLARVRPAGRPLELNPALEPAFYTFVAKVCDLSHAPMPTRIFLDGQLNAAAGLSHLLGKDLVLTVGVPLVAALDAREFAGVLAHEFGHFSQTFNLRLVGFVRRIHLWFMRAIYQRDAMDLWLEEAGMNPDSAAELLLYNTARLGVWLSRSALWLVFVMGETVTCFLVRQSEFDADAVWIRVAGSDSCESGLRRLAFLGALLEKTYADLLRGWQRTRRLPDDFSAFLLWQETRVPLEVRERFQDTLGLARTRVLDSHPCPGDRIRCARRAGQPGVVHLEAPASALFSRFDVVSRYVSQSHYRDDLRLRFHNSSLQPIEDFTEAHAAV